MAIPWTVSIARPNDLIAAGVQVEDVAAILPVPSDRAAHAEFADLIEEERELVRAGPVVDVLVRHNTSMGASQKGKEIERPSQLDSLIEPDATKSISNDQNVSIGSPTAEIMPQLGQYEGLSSRVEAAELSEEIDNIEAQGAADQDTDGLNDYYLNMPATYWKRVAVHWSGTVRYIPPETEALWTKLFGAFGPYLPIIVWISLFRSMCLYHFHHTVQRILPEELENGSNHFLDDSRASPLLTLGMTVIM